MRGRILFALTILLAILPVLAQDQDPEAMRREIMELSKKIEQVFKAWKTEKNPARKQHYWETMVQQIVTYNQKRQAYEKLSKQEEETLSFPQEAQELLREIRNLERQIFRTQDALHRAIQEYQAMSPDTPPPKVRVKEMQILKLRAQKDKILKEYDKKLREFRKKFPEFIKNTEKSVKKSQDNQGR